MTETELLALRIQARAYYDELEAIEKQAMLNAIPVIEEELQKQALDKEALGLFGRAYKGFKLLKNRGLGRGLQNITRAYQTGTKRGMSIAGKKALDPGAAAGLVNAMRTPVGSALAVGGGAAGAGLLGAGYLAGRGSGGQNVYVR